MHLFGGVLLHFKNKNCSLKVSLFYFSVYLTRFQFCDPLKSLYWVTSVPHQKFLFPEEDLQYHPLIEIQCLPIKVLNTSILTGADPEVLERGGALVGALVRFQMV